MKIRDCKVIAIENQKGGVGKTTQSVNLAYAIQELYAARVLLIDTDTKQGSAMDWHAASDGALLHVIRINKPTLEKDIKHLSNDYDYIIIDGVGHMSEVVGSAIRCADIVLIPIQPSPYDVWGSKDIVDLIQARHSVTEGKPKSAFVIMRKKQNTILGRDLTKALKEYNLPVFESCTHDRVAFPTSAAVGSTVLKSFPNEEAAKEIIALSKELMEFIK